jgi:hypothetical protein
MFIQSQALPWSPDASPFGRMGAAYRLLSRDSTSGAATLLMRYPPGWRADPGAIGATEELFVLDGALEIGTQRYGFYDYGCLPAGYPRGEMRSPGGAVVVTMFDAEPTSAARGEPDLRRLVVHVDTTSRGLDGWVQNPYTRYLPGTGVQRLREDPDTGEITILYCALPFRFMAKRWSHPQVQEMYVLAGDYAINDLGVMRPGAYGWWQPHRYHGPYGSRGGFMMLIRAVGGPLANLIEEDIVPVDFDAPYRPELPPELAVHAREIAVPANY